jgi:hypothetical protein
MQDKTTTEEPDLTMYIQMVEMPNMHLLHSLSKKTCNKLAAHVKEFQKIG